MNEKSSSVFVENLRKLRGKMSRAAFAEQLRISPNTYYRYETGERVPDIDVLLRIASHANVTTDWLLGREQDMFDLLRSGAALLKDTDVKDVAVVLQAKLATIQTEAKTIGAQAESIAGLVHSMGMLIGKGDPPRAPDGMAKARW